MSLLLRSSVHDRPTFVDGARELRRQIESICGPRFVVALSSCGQGAGVSTASRALAEALAEEQTRRVLLIDANSRDPSQHSALGLPREGGLSDILEGTVDASAATASADGREFSVLPAGGDGERLARGLVSERFGSLLKRLREDFECILLDCAPVHLSPETSAVARLADGLIMVLEAGTTRWEAARAARAALDRSGVRLLGAVLNKRRYRVPGSLYSRV